MDLHVTVLCAIVYPGPLLVGRVQPAVCSPSGWCLSKGVGGQTHAHVSPGGARSASPFIQQPSCLAGGHEGGEEDQQPQTPCYLCAV